MKYPKRVRLTGTSLFSCEHDAMVMAMHKGGKKNGWKMVVKLMRKARARQDQLQAWYNGGWVDPVL